MKRILTFLVMGLCLTLIDASAQKILLKNGQTNKAEFFNYDKLQDALDKSEGGDTILFTQGVFPAGVTISKKVTLIGTGISTKLNGNVTISLEGAQTYEPRALESLNILGSVNITSPINGLKFSYVRIGTRLTMTAKMTGMRINNCYIYDLLGEDEYHEGTIVYNSIVNYATNHCSNIQFYYCLILTVNCKYWYSTLYDSLMESFSGKVYNSIIKKTYGDNGNYLKLRSGCHIENSIYNSAFIVSEDMLIGKNYPLDIQELNSMKLDSPEGYDYMIAKGYLSSDGETPVGPFGGLTPYDPEFKPAGPIVSDYQAKYDPNTGMLNVNVKVSNK